MPSPAGTRLEATGPPTPTATAAVVIPTPTQTRSQRQPAEAFGTLPLLALPGDGGFRPRYTLAYDKAAELPALPGSADVYRLLWTTFTPAAVHDLARRLGLTGPVDTLGPGTFQVQDQANGRLFVAHGRIMFNRTGSHPAAPITDPYQAGEQARLWLIERQLLPADAGPPRVRVLPPDAELALVTFLPVGPQPLITPEPSVTVILDGGGRIREMDMLWPAEQDIAPYPLADMDAAWDAIQRGDAHIEIDTDITADPDQRLTGQARLTRVTIGYALAAGTDADEAAFLQPVYIFSGTVRFNDRPGVVNCHIYVPALRDYRWPRG